MAVLHLQLDIDSDVHPELHAMLCSIGSSRSQAERLRQLAATGLVWERLRLQAYAPMQVPELGPEPASTPAAASEAGASFFDEIAAPPAQPVGEVHAGVAQGADLSDFVDLSDAVVLADLADLPGRADLADRADRADLADLGDLADLDTAPNSVHPFEPGDTDHDVGHVQPVDRPIDIVPPPVQLPAQGGQPPLMLREIRSAVLALPVLTEVVDTAELVNMQAAAAAANEAAPAAAAVRFSAQIHELAPAPKAAPRSRLMRMQERGLFKNE